MITTKSISRMGALMGGGVGLTIGFIFGSWSILRCVFNCQWTFEANISCLLEGVLDHAVFLLLYHNICSAVRLHFLSFSLLALYVCFSGFEIDIDAMRR